MLLDQAYFEFFNQSQLEEFYAEFRNIEQNFNDEDKSSSCVQRGHLFERFGFFTWAMDSFKKAIDADHQNEQAYLALMNLYRILNLCYSEAKLIKRYFDIFPCSYVLADRLNRLNQNYPKKQVTFYLPCYNVARYIGSTLDAIMNQTYEIDELLIIDDGSTDRTIEIAKNYPVEIIHHPENKGLAAARNTAVNKAKSEFLATVDTDAQPEPFWLEKLMLAFNDERIAGAGGRLIEKYTHTAADRWRQIRMRQEHGDSICEQVNLFGSNTVFRVAALKTAGGYNPALRTNYEDVDICTKLLKQGFKTKYIPDAICHHLRKDSLLSAVDTCYNWRKPYFEQNGAYTNHEWLLKKGINDIETNLVDIMSLIKAQQFEVLYPNFLSCIRTVFKDLNHFYEHSSSYESMMTIKASYVLLIHQCIQSGKISDQLLNYVLEDIADLVEVLNRFEEQNFLNNLNTQIIAAAKKKEDISKTLIRLNAHSGAYLNYIQAIFSELAKLFALDPIYYNMIETSARRVRYEEKNSPYDCAKKIMILNPPWNPKGRRGVRAGSRWPFTGENCADSNLKYTPFPFFLAYLSSVLKDKSIQNVVVDGIAEELTNLEFIERVAGYAPEIIVMETATASYMADNLWLLKIKERLPEAKIIWVGPHVTVLGAEILLENPFVDFIIRGEFECAAAELIEKLVKNETYNRINGLMYFDQNKNLVDNGRSNPIEIDSLPFPQRLTLPIYKYNDLFAGMQYPSLQVHASRGCPFDCIYCVWPQVLYRGEKYRTRTPKVVVDEIEDAIRNFGFRSFYFDDDTFNIGKKRIERICEELIQRNLNIPWGAMARADTADYDMLYAMKKAGLVGIKFGVESGDQALVDAAEKKLDLDSVRQALEWCKELGIKTHLTFTFGLPGETPHTVATTINFAKELNPDTIQFSITTPFPGTKYFDILKRTQNLITEEWEKYDGALYTVVKTDTLSKEELEKTVQCANFEFHQNKIQLSQPGGF